MNQTNEENFRRHCGPMIASLRATLKSGEGRNVSAKEANYLEIMDLFRVASIIPQDNGAKELANSMKTASGVSQVIDDVTVILDNDQLPHQHPTDPTCRIGSRIAPGKNRFVQRCNAKWHRDNTMKHMATWVANDLVVDTTKLDADVTHAAKILGELLGNFSITGRRPAVASETGRPGFLKTL